MENLQIITLTPALANDQKELNVYVEKATDYKGKLAKIDTVNEENYEDAKKFRAEITSAKTSIEATRKTLKRPLLDLGSAIDERARELSKPFEEMKDELQGKIWVHEEAENERKRLEAERVEKIIEDIGKTDSLEALETFYKSLEIKDQRKKSVAEAGTLHKEKILEAQKQAKKKEITDKIDSINDEKELRDLDLGEFSSELAGTVINRINKIKLDALEQEKKDEAEKKAKTEKTTADFIISLTSKSLEFLKSGTVEFPTDSDKEKIQSWINTRIMELENEKLKADLEVSKSKEAPAPVVEAPKVTTSTGVAPKTDTQKLFDITEEINSIFSDKGYSVTFENVDISRNGEKGYFIKWK